MSNIRVRFAPSPTGTLHVGGARTALFNWLYARNQGGVFVLRIEDTDRERSTSESHEQILRAMRWLGLDWDEGPGVGGDHGPYVQSERRSLYEEYAKKLLDEGLGYRCYCTPEELEAWREEALAKGLNPGYNGRCRSLTAEQEAAFQAEGRPSVIRVRMPDEGAIRWGDVVHGLLEFQCSEITDWVAVKSDGFPTYNFAVVVDDGLMEISHVLRGDDHVSNTAQQIHLFKAFGFHVPKFGHMPMILGPDKKRLSKRHGAASVEEFRDAHWLPQAMVNYLALLGWSDGTDQEVFTVEQLVKKFGLKRLNNTAAVFDPEKARHINAEHMKQLSLEQKVELALPVLVESGLATAEEAKGEELRGRLAAVISIMGNRFVHLGEVGEHLVCYFRDDYPVDAEAGAALDPSARDWMGRLAAAYEALADFSPEEAERALRELAEGLGVKAGQLIHPARFAMTGSPSGPGVFEIMEVLGKERVVRRLRELRVA